MTLYITGQRAYPVFPVNIIKAFLTVMCWVFSKSPCIIKVTYHFAVFWGCKYLFLLNVLVPTQLLTRSRLMAVLNARGTEKIQEGKFSIKCAQYI